MGDTFIVDSRRLLNRGGIMEKIKYALRFKRLANFYYWRNYDQQEIDLIEERQGKLYGYEVKWKKKTIRAPQEWLKTYKNASFEIINKENYSKFLREF